MDHIHEHAHEHCHEHTHGDLTSTHTDEFGGDSDRVASRTKALLAYMIDHNDHHADELAALLSSVDGAAKKKLSEAIGSFEVANVQLREVLALLEE